MPDTLVPLERWDHLLSASCEHGVAEERGGRRQRHVTMLTVTDLQDELPGSGRKALEALLGPHPVPALCDFGGVGEPAVDRLCCSLEELGQRPADTFARVSAVV